MTRARSLRAGAVVIALLAVLDPTLTSARRVPAEVAIVHGAPGPGSRVGAEVPPTPEVDYESVFAAVSERFDAVRGPWPGAAATVLVGEGLPSGSEALPAPVFRVVPARSAPQTRIVHLDVPATAPLDGTVRVTVRVSPHTEDGLVDVVLLDDTRELDRARAVSIVNGGGVLRAKLTFVPPGPGVHTLTVALVEMEGEGEGEPRPILRRVVEVRESRWRALFLDGRPSWPSTFARRALDRDPRFDLSGRIETSPGLATTFGAPPASPEEPGALDAWDVVVVGAPDGLSPARAAALERWVRLEGGTLVLLPDHVETGTGSAAPWHGLAGTDEWEEGVAEAEVEVTTEAIETGSLPLFLARTRIWPRVLPRGVRVVARDPEGAPVVWERPLGLGTIVVSGAVDAWQFRDPQRSGFEAGWRGLLGRAAAARAPGLELQLAPGGHPTRSAPPFGPPPGGGMIVRAGAPIRLHARTRDALSQPTPGDSLSLLATASLVHESGEVVPLAVWPGRDPMSLESEFEAPSRPGTWRVTLEVDDHLASVPLIVDSATTPFEEVGQLDHDLVEAWVGARGGSTMEFDRLGELLDALETGLSAERRPERWHPMRSPWWILPFTLALAGEWWMRRRRGLP